MFKTDNVKYTHRKPIFDEPSYAVHTAQLCTVCDDVVITKMVKCQRHTVHTEAQKIHLLRMVLILLESAGRILKSTAGFCKKSVPSAANSRR